MVNDDNDKFTNLFICFVALYASTVSAVNAVMC